VLLIPPGGKFATGVNDTGGKLPPVSTTPVANNRSNYQTAGNLKWTWNKIYLYANYSRQYSCVVSSRLLEDFHPPQNIHKYPFSSDANNGEKWLLIASELIKEWATPRQGRPKGLCSVNINPLWTYSSYLAKTPTLVVHMTPQCPEGYQLLVWSKHGNRRKNSSGNRWRWIFSKYILL
jgi:hypothetical protein